ncbi:docking protein 5-like [Anneissia japonica]|uniref:docking protein 5-like n=1 Tax=Anneissia japonica TaxID=1529436 RepID=UPI0014254B38|nr:docking protein 5-like [Anneissia japonica]XP_033115713.1 docking protein 5-like [Anneissia japonica]XP_033115714.1 docking protein 5-like [Anneissia japonica]XP_033115715.1 docking protein 5-like [Anneissia japonica]XP_033115716.1 docking protein 5-like [Anneissia japonica]XP_033115717.1 docking protein 5-like [Anneissia japonica]XP_033115718.1 docking protein 5-like [Anneissia japonica]
MTSEFTDTVKEGYVRLKSRKLGVWQKRWIVFRKASSTGPKRLEKFMDERCANHRGYHKIIILDHVIRVARLASNVKKHGVIITFSDNSSRQFACDSEVDADSWCKTFAMEVCPENCGILAGEPDILLSGLQREKNERFHVFLQPSAHLSVSGECTLQVTEDSVFLWDVIDPKLKLATWPLQSLRRYGKDNYRFLLESGRYCDTGEGMFTFTTTEGYEIYQRVHRLSMALAASQEKNGSNKDIRSSFLSEKSVMPDFLDENVRQAQAVEQAAEMTQTARRHSSSFHIPLNSPRRKPYVILRTLVPKEQETLVTKDQVTNMSKDQAALIPNEQTSPVPNKGTPVSEDQAIQMSKVQAIQMSKDQATQMSHEQVAQTSKDIKMSKNMSTQMSMDQATFMFDEQAVHHQSKNSKCQTNEETPSSHTELNISDLIISSIENESDTSATDVWIPRHMCNTLEAHGLASASRTQSTL